MRAWDNNHPVAVGNHNISLVYVRAIALHRNLAAGKTVMVYRGGGNNPGREHRKSNLAQVSNVTHAAINYGATVAARHHGGSHESTHSGDVSAVFNRHYVD